MIPNRRATIQISAGSLAIGGNAPVSVQSMTNTPTADAQSTIQQIHRAALAGAELMRVSVPDKQSLEALPEILRHSPIPVCADIHFDHRLALGALKSGIHKLRINPGNIGGSEKIKRVVREALSRNVPIRIGINAGSLEKNLLKKYGRPTPEALLESALKHIQILENLSFTNIAVSLKSSDVMTTIDGYKMLSQACRYPLHIGVTESGTLQTGAIRSAVGLGVLLYLGIGDTLRVSLAADPVQEIRAGYRILESIGIRRRGPTVIACPTCSRTRIDIISLARKVEEHLQDKSTPLTVAVMGCIVNGPGEARDADIGIAGGKGEALLFKKGRIVRKIKESEIFKALVELFDDVANELQKAPE